MDAFLPQFGNFFLTVAAFVVALSVIVFVHEFGHYLVGKLSGIRPVVFSIGFGPVLASWVDRAGTRWQLAAIPFGGFVKFLGDADAASATADSETLAELDEEARRHTMEGAPLWARFLTVLAGPMFNFLFSILVFAGIALVSGMPVEEPVIGKIYPVPGVVNELEVGDRIEAVEDRRIETIRDLYDYGHEAAPRAPLVYTITRDGRMLSARGPFPLIARITGIQPRSAAAAAGLRIGDIIIEADGRPLIAFSQLQEIVRKSEGRALSLKVWREGRTFTVTVTPREVELPDGKGGFVKRLLVGITGGLFFDPPMLRPGPLSALGLGASQVWGIVVTSLNGVWHMISGAISACNLQGPIGIAESSADAAQQGIGAFIWFIAVLSTAIGLVNLFPVPVLDGGHLVFFAWEAVTGRPPSERVMRILMSIGFALLMTLMAFALFNDIFC